MLLASILTLILAYLSIRWLKSAENRGKQVSDRDECMSIWPLDDERAAEREYLAGCEQPSPIGATPPALREERVSHARRIAGEGQ